MATNAIKINFIEGAAPGTPAAGEVVQYAKADGKLYSKDDAGAETALGGGLTNPMTTSQDIIVGGASGTPGRLAKGSDGQVLTVDPTTHNLVWATPSASGSVATDAIWNAKGDLAGGTGADTAARLAVGTNGQVLTADSAETTGLKWATPTGSGATIQYPGLKPATPTYDFAGAALDGAFSANSTFGSFTTSHCKTQGEAWGGSSLEMQFSEQMGAIYVSHANTDLDFQVGGIRKMGFGNTSAVQVMFGIAALNSSGTGVGVTGYTDGTMYFATITTWAYTANSTSWPVHGMTGLSDGDWWLRLTRVSGTWTGYISQSGRAWDKTFATRADSITVDRLAFGLMFTGGVAYSGRLIADYFDVAV